MTKIKEILQKEKNQLLSQNDKQKGFEKIKNHINDLYIFVKNSSEWKYKKWELEENFLTPILIFLWKIEKLQKLVQNYKIPQIIIEVNFWIINYNDFTNYYNFIDIEWKEWINAVMGNTTSIFNKLQKSSIFPQIYLLQQEVYEHEDDTDDSEYYIIIKL